MCGATVLPCLECHPSCTACTTPGRCDACSAGSDAELMAESSFCRCVDGKGSSFKIDGKTYHEMCAPCYSSCTTCFDDQNTACYSCKASNAYVHVGMLLDRAFCMCNDGLIPFGDPTLDTDCQACVPAGCPECTGPTEADCNYYRDADNFVFTMGFLALPLTTAESICFRIPLSLQICEYSALEDIMGTLIVNSNVYIPKEKQCNSLIRALWPYATYWFNHFFPAPFNPPTRVSPKFMVESILKLYILQFTPASMEKNPDWTTIINVLRAPAENWKNYLVWGGETPAYTIDRGVTTLSLPKDLKEWFRSCAFPECPDLYLLNINSSVCDEADCSMKTECKTTSLPKPCLD